MQHPREAARAWVLSALTEELHTAGPQEIGDTADMLLAIAQDYDVPVEECIAWIHNRMPRTGSIASAWVLHSIEYAQLRERLCHPAHSAPAR